MIMRWCDQCHLHYWLLHSCLFYLRMTGRACEPYWIQNEDGHQQLKWLRKRSISQAVRVSAKLSNMPSFAWSIPSGENASTAHNQALCWTSAWGYSRLSTTTARWGTELLMIRHCSISKAWGLRQQFEDDLSSVVAFSTYTVNRAQLLSSDKNLPADESCCCYIYIHTIFEKACFVVVWHVLK